MEAWKDVGIVLFSQKQSTFFSLEANYLDCLLNIIDDSSLTIFALKIAYPVF